MRLLFSKSTAKKSYKINGQHPADLNKNSTILHLSVKRVIVSVGPGEQDSNFHPNELSLSKIWNIVVKSNGIDLDL